MKKPKSPSILQEAETIINGSRQKDYGEAGKSFDDYATVWSLLLKTSVSSQQVALCMIAIKLLRESNKPQRDNRVDLCGYTALLNQLETVQPS